MPRMHIGDDVHVRCVGEPFDDEVWTIKKLVEATKRGIIGTKARIADPALVLTRMIDGEEVVLNWNGTNCEPMPMSEWAGRLRPVGGQERAQHTRGTPLPRATMIRRCLNHSVGMVKVNKARAPRNPYDASDGQDDLGINDIARAMFACGNEKRLYRRIMDACGVPEGLRDDAGVKAAFVVAKDLVSAELSIAGDGRRDDKSCFSRSCGREAWEHKCCHATKVLLLTAVAMQVRTRTTGTGSTCRVRDRALEDGSARRDAEQMLAQLAAMGRHAAARDLAHAREDVSVSLLLDGRGPSERQMWALRQKAITVGPRQARDSVRRLSQHTKLTQAFAAADVVERHRDKCR